MATPWQPSGTLSLNPPGTNPFDPRIREAVNAARGNASSARAWQSAMNSGIRRVSSRAKRGDPRALAMAASLGPAVRVGSAPDARGIAQEGIAGAAMDEQDNAAYEGMRGRILDAMTGRTPVFGASETVPSGAKVTTAADGTVSRPLVSGGSFGQAAGVGLGNMLGPLAPFASPALGALGRRIGESFSQASNPVMGPMASNPSPSAAAPTSMAPAQPSIFDIAGEAARMKGREQQEMGLRDKPLGGGIMERVLPGGRMTTDTMTGNRLVSSQYGSGSSSPTPTPAAQKSFGGMPGLSFFQEAANRQGIGNKFASPQANSSQNLMAAAMQQAYERSRKPR